jgi:hypothetical protein
VQASEPTTESSEIKLSEAGERLEAIGVREQPEQAIGDRLEGTAKQPENFGAINSRYPMITMHVARLARFR